jgi:sugar O-acyltransferase (sialic acid O-acetyltransferase NeuD family)
VAGDRPSQLLLIGAGGFARETAEVVHAINDLRMAWDLLGFLDDDPALHGLEKEGLPVLGPISSVRLYPEAYVVACTGSPRNNFSRKRIIRSLGLPPFRYATLVHPTAVVPRSARIGPGSVLLASVVLTAAVRVGSHVAMMPGVVLTHDNVVNDFVTFGAGAQLAGTVTIGEGAYIGAGSLIRENLSVGAWSLVGMGAVVTRSVPEGEVWAGVPARCLRSVQVPVDVLDPLASVTTPTS